MVSKDNPLKCLSSLGKNEGGTVEIASQELTTGIFPVGQLPDFQIAQRRSRVALQARQST